MSVFAEATSDDSALLDRIRSRDTLARTAYRDLRSDWYMNVAFLLGHQYVEIDEATGRIVQPPTPAWRERAVRNIIAPTVDVYVNRATSQWPTFRVIPATSEDQDQSAAVVGGHALQYVSRRVSLQSKLKACVQNACLCGTGFLIPLFDAQQNFLDIDVPSSFDMFPEPGAQSQHDCHWIIRRHSFQIEEARLRFNRPELQANHGFEEDNITGRLLKSYESGGSQDRITIIEYWQTTDSTYEKGIHAIATDQEVLSRADLDELGIPVIPIHRAPAPGRYFGRPLVTGLRNPQKAYNAATSRILENFALHSGLKWLSPRTAELDEPAINNLADEVIEWSGNGPSPREIAPPSLPAWIENMLDAAYRDIDRISGVHEASRGLRPEGVTSGRALAFLQEADNVAMSHTLTSMAEALSTLGGRLLALWKRHIPEPRTIQYLGENDRYEIASFSVMDLKGNDVYVEQDSLLWESQAVKEDNARQDFDKGIATLEEVRDVLGYTQGGDPATATDAERDRARWETEQLFLGTDIPVFSLENHKLHIEEHRKGALQGGKLYEADPSARDLFIAHYGKHEQRAEPPAEGPAPTAPSNGSQPGKPPLAAPGNSLASMLKLSPGGEEGALRSGGWKAQPQESHEV